MPARPIPHPVVQHHNPFRRDVRQVEPPTAHTEPPPTSSGAESQDIIQARLDLLTFPIVATATPYTVATLPAAANYPMGFAVVTDATLTMITGLGLAPVGGGANIVPCFSDGATWRII